MAVTLAQNPNPLDDKLEEMQQDFAAEKDRMGSELQATREALDFTRAQLRKTQAKLLITEKLLGEQPEPSMKLSKFENINGQTNTTKSLSLSQILQLWKQSMLHSQVNHDRNPLLPEDVIHVDGTQSVYNGPDAAELTTTSPMDPIKMARYEEAHRNAPSLPLQSTRRQLTGPTGSNGPEAISFNTELGVPADGLKALQTVIFDTATVNVDGAYNVQNGVFTTPVNGVYHFTVTIMVFPHEKIETELVVNGRQALLTFGAGTTEFSQGTSSAIIRLESGDRVWVRILSTTGQGINSHLMGGGWTSFSGFQIR